MSKRKQEEEDQPSKKQKTEEEESGSNDNPAQIEKDDKPAHAEDADKKLRIRWDKLQEVFENESTDAVENFKAPMYLDHELEGHVTEDDVDKLLQEIQLKFDKIAWSLNKSPAAQGALSWIGESEQQRMEVLTYDNGLDLDYVIALQLDDIAHIVGNSGGHPFVLTNQFAFDNSDGSTNEDVDFREDISPHEVLEFAMSKTKEYLFNQVH